MKTPNNARSHSLVTLFLDNFVESAENILFLRKLFAVENLCA
jgi:hypothetical protein